MHFLVEPQPQGANTHCVNTRHFPSGAISSHISTCLGSRGLYGQVGLHVPPSSLHRLLLIYCTTVFTHPLSTWAHLPFPHSPKWFLWLVCSAVSPLEESWGRDLSGFGPTPNLLRIFLAPHFNVKDCSLLHKLGHPILHKALSTGSLDVLGEKLRFRLPPRSPCKEGPGPNLGPDLVLHLSSGNSDSGSYPTPVAGDGNN